MPLCTTPATKGQRHRLITATPVKNGHSFVQGKCGICLSLLLLNEDSDRMDTRASFTDFYLPLKVATLITTIMMLPWIYELKVVFRPTKIHFTSFCECSLQSVLFRYAFLHKLKILITYNNKKK